MAAESPFVGNLVSQTAYCLDVVRRLTNVGGVCHRAVARERLSRALDATDAVAHPVWSAALKGGLLARRLVAPVTGLYDVVVGTGRHRRLSDEPYENDVLLPPRLRFRWLNASSAGADVQPRCPLFGNSLSHGERVQYLANRMEQHFHHPADMGLLGAAALWATVPVFAVASALGAAVGLVGGPVAYGALTLVGRKPEDASAFMSESAATVGALGACTMFGALTTAPTWMALQGLRALSAAAKGVVTAVGVGIGATVGLVGTALPSHRPLALDAPPSAAAEPAV